MITIKRVGRIGDITVDHIPRELSRLAFYYIHEGGSVIGSSIPEGGLEIPILMYFVHKNNAVLNKMKTFVINKIYHLHEKFEFDVKEVVGDRGER